MKFWLTAALALTSFAVVAGVQAQSATNPGAPRPGVAAPALSFTKLLQAPTGAKVDWPSLHGKVVVLEFWATWCAPCVAEIPILNSLQASVDPTRIVFLSVDDEEPAAVEKFLARKPIKGWLGFDTTGKTLERYGIQGRPATIVIDPTGHIASSTTPLPALKAEQLNALADGKKVALGGDVDPAVQKQLDKDTEQAFNAEIATPASTDNAIFAINIFAVAPDTAAPASATPDPKKADPDTRIVTREGGRLDITNGSVKTILSYGAHLRSSRMTTRGTLPDTLYNLHVVAPHADDQQLARAIEMAVSSATGIVIDHHNDNAEALILTSTPAAAEHIKDSSSKGFAYYDKDKQMLQCVSANVNSVAEALEVALEKPVLNDSKLIGRISGSWKLAAKDLAAANDLLAKDFGLTLTSARRPVETVVLTVPPSGPDKSKTKPDEKTTASN